MTPTTSRDRVRPLFLAGSWCLVVLGLGHLAFMAFTLVRGPAAEESLVLRTMAGTATSSLLGIPRSLLALFYGFSATMGLLATAVGALNLAAERLAPEVLTRGRGLLRLDLTVCLLALAVAVVAFPAPAVAILVLACAAFTSALAVTAGGAHAGRV
jgi:hypothetical protein